MMTMYKQIIATIKNIRDRESLEEIINTAEARDAHLANIEAEVRRKRLWAKFSHIKVGDSVFVHKQPEGKLQWLWGKQLTVKQVKPRSKEIVVRGDPRGEGATLTPHMMDTFRLSLEPSVVAFHNALHGERMVVGLDKSTKRDFTFKDFTTRHKRDQA